jgi:hypothetical protein
LTKHLHIVSLDVPWPADYGGVVDLFYKLKYLQQQGVKIYLHCFTNGRPPQQELNEYCESVSYYQRKSNSSSFSFSLPLIVKSRINNELLLNLKKDNHPVLLEGIHCSYYLYKNLLHNRKVVLRLHNVEFEYYHYLAKHEKNWLKKIYFLHESRLLKKYEKTIAAKAPVVTVSQHDAAVYKNLFNAPAVHYLPVFIPHTLAVGKEGNGCFCLYHGNLSVNENEVAAIWLLQNVFNDVNIPFVIAGKNPSKKLSDLAHKHKHTCIVANPSEKEMQDMIYKAQVHVLPSFNNTGIKLKLLNALFNGRHCLVNQQGVAGSGLESVCHIANDAAAFKTALQQLYNQPFTENEKQQRQGLLLREYNNEENAKRLLTFLW